MTSKRSGLLILQLVLGFVLASESLLLTIAQRDRNSPAHWPLLILGLAELIAAVLFLIPRTLRLGGVLLIAILAAAAAFHVLHGQFRVGSLAVYAAAAFAVITGERRT